MATERNHVVKPHLVPRVNHHMVTPTALIMLMALMVAMPAAPELGRMATVLATDQVVLKRQQQRMLPEPTAPARRISRCEMHLHHLMMSLNVLFVLAKVDHCGHASSAKLKYVLFVRESPANCWMQYRLFCQAIRFSW